MHPRKCTIYNAGFRLYENAERYLKPGEEMQRLFRQYPDAINRTQEIAEACRFSLDSLKYVYPGRNNDRGRTAQEELTMLTWEGQRKFGETIPAKHPQTIKHELAFIEQMNYATFLRCTILCVLQGSKTFFARAGVLLPIPLFAIAWYYISRSNKI